MGVRLLQSLLRHKQKAALRAEEPQKAKTCCTEHKNNHLLPMVLRWESSLFTILNSKIYDSLFMIPLILLLLLLFNLDNCNHSLCRDVLNFRIWSWGNPFSLVLKIILTMSNSLKAMFIFNKVPEKKPQPTAIWHCKDDINLRHKVCLQFAWLCNTYL